MTLGSAMVATASPREPATCLPVNLPIRAKLLILSMYSGFALSLRTDFVKIIYNPFYFRRRLPKVVISNEHQCQRRFNSIQLLKYRIFLPMTDALILSITITEVQLLYLPPKLSDKAHQ